MSKFNTTCEKITEEELQQLKLKIKEWEHYFKAKYEREPTRQDIKDRPKLYDLYSRYNHLKDPHRKGKRQLSGSTTLNTSVSLHVHSHSLSNTPQIVPVFKSTDKEASTPSKNTPLEPDTEFNSNGASQSCTTSPEKPQILAVGPTPQLHGRVLGIFDMQKVIPKSPSSTPTSRILFPTAVKKRTSPIMTSMSKVSSTISDSTTGSPTTPKKLSTTLPITSPSVSSSNKTVSTPKSHKINHEFELWSRLESSTVTETGSPLKKIPDTPSYFNRTTNIFTESPGKNHGLSPSPIAPQKIQRALSTLIADYKSMQEEGLEEEEEEIMREMELFNEAALAFAQKQQTAQEESITPPLYKKRGQKRTTRRSTMKPAPIQAARDSDNNKATNSLATGIKAESTKLTRGEEGEEYNTDEDPDNKPMNDLKATQESETGKKRKIKQPQENFRRLKLRNSGYKGPRKFPFKNRH